MNTRYGVEKWLAAVVMAGVSVAAAPALAVNGEVVYQYTCKMCHGPGSGVAPKTGDIEAWEPRVRKGRQQLYDHAINGFRGEGYMPPKGGNRNLTDEQVKAAVDYMLQHAG